MLRLVFAILAAISFAHSAGAQHGTVNLANTGQLQVMELHAFNGGELKLWCPANSAFQIYTVPKPIAITAAANNGAGLIRLTLAANARTFNAGERVNVLNAVAVTLTDYLVTPVDATHIDLQGSSFASSFTGTVTGATVGNVTSIRKNGVAAQSISNEVNYGVFARWADAGCTYAELSVVTCTSGCYTTPSLNGQAAGFPVDTAGDNGTLVGLVRKQDIGTGAGAVIQGNGNYNLLLSWYNRHWMELQISVGGTITSTSWTAFGSLATGRIGFLTWSEDTGGGGEACLSIDAAAAFVSAQYGYIGIGVNGKDPGGPGGWPAPMTVYTVTNAGPNPPAPVISAAWFPNNSDVNTLCARIPVNNNIGGGWYEYATYGKFQGPTPNTLRNGVLGTSTFAVRAQF